MKSSIKYQEKHPNTYETFLIAILILFIYSWYKNGLSYYLSNTCNFITTLKPLIILFTSFLTGFIVDYLTKNKHHLNLVTSLLVALTIPYQTNIYLYLIILFLSLIILSFLKIPLNKVSIIHLLIILLLTNNYQNIFEEQNTFFYGTLDIFFGRSIGGLGSTNIFLILLIYLFLCTRFYYKKNIPPLIIITYILLSFIFDITKENPNLILNILNSNVIFASVFLYPMNHTSPLETKYQTIYAILSGILIFLFIRIFNIKEGVYIVLIIVNLINYLWEKIIYQSKQTLSKKSK